MALNLSEHPPNVERTRSANEHTSTISLFEAGTARLYASSATSSGRVGQVVHGACITSSGSDEGPVCRICRLSRDELDEELTTTGCKCKGSISYCHLSCLQMWIDKQKHAHCELCGQPYCLQVTPGIRQRPPPRWRPPPRPRRPLDDLDESAIWSHARNRRLWFVSILAVTAMAILACAVLTDRTSRPVERDTKQTDEQSKYKSSNHESVRSLSKTMLIFSCVVYFCIALIWLFTEKVVLNYEQLLNRLTHVDANIQRRGILLTNLNPNFHEIARHGLDVIEIEEPEIEEPELVSSTDSLGGAVNNSDVHLLV